jgi:hypothetical protein
VAVLVGVVAITTGWDAKPLSEFPTAKAEAHSMGTFDPGKADLLSVFAVELQPALADEARMPDLDGAVGWLNSAPYRLTSLFAADQ